MSDINEMRQQQLEMIADNQRRQEELDEFLGIIKQIESSGGVDVEHPVMQSGIHKGQAAIGSYGLMPQTIQELARRGGHRELASLPAEEMRPRLEEKPELEEQLAHQLGRRVLRKQQDPEKAAYSWYMGHNLSPEEIEKRGYEEHPYVQKFRKLRDILGEK